MADTSDCYDDDNGIDINLIRAEIDAAADQWRRRDPEIVQLERNIEQAWLNIAPIGAIIKDEQLLDRFETLGQVKLAFPAEPRRFIRVIKRAVNRAISWYIQYLVGQLNGVLKLLKKALRHMDSRIETLESTTRLNSGFIQLHDATPDPPPETADMVAKLVGVRQCAVLSCGNGSIVESIYNGGGSGYGIEQDDNLVSLGTQRGLDIRQGCILDHMANLDDQSLESIVLSGVVEVQPVGALVKVGQEVKRVLTSSGIVVIAVASLDIRTESEKELLLGCGLSPHSWQQLMSRIGFDTQMIATADARISSLILARPS